MGLVIPLVSGGKQTLTELEPGDMKVEAQQSTVSVWVYTVQDKWERVNEVLGGFHVGMLFERTNEELSQEGYVELGYQLQVSNQFAAKYYTPGGNIGERKTRTRPAH